MVADMAWDNKVELSPIEQNRRLVQLCDENVSLARTDDVYPYRAAIN